MVRQLIIEAGPVLKAILLATLTLSLGRETYWKSAREEAPEITHSRDESFIKEDVLEILPYPL